MSCERARPRPTRRVLPLVVACTLAGPCLCAAEEQSAQDTAGAPTREAEVAGPFQTSDPHALHRYAASFGRDVKGVFAPANARPLLFGAAFVLGGSFLDRPAENYFTRHPHHTAGRTGATLGQGLVVAGATTALLGAGALTQDGRFHDMTYDLSQAVLVNTAYTFVLKNTVHRTRPDGSNALSFPSGHTSTAFAAATVLQSHYGLKVGIPAYGMASFIGASRMASRAHHLSDVLAGATLGYVVGRTVVGHDADRPGAHRRLALGTAASPSGDGVGLALSFGF